MAKKRRRSGHAQAVANDTDEAIVGSPLGGQEEQELTLSGRSTNWLLAYLLPLVAIWALSAVFGIFPIEAEDIFSNIVTGRYLWEHRSVPEFDPFSFTGPHRWFLNRPLPSLLFFGAHSLGGFPGVQLFCFAILGLTYSTLYVGWTRRTRTPLANFVIVTTMILITCSWFQTRIYILGYLFAVSYFLLITAASPRWMLLTLPLQVLWINTHPSAILGVFFVGLWGLTRIMRERKIDRFSLVIVLAVILCNALSPTGLGSYTKFIDETFGDHPSRTNILEWLSPFNRMVVEQPSIWWFFGTFPLLAYVWLFSARNRARVRNAEILLNTTLIFFAVSLTSSRHIPFYYFSLGSLCVCAFEFAWRSQRFPVAVAVFARRYYAAIAAFVGVVTIVIVIRVALFGYLQGESDRLFGFGVKERKFPRRPLEMLKAAKVGGNIFADYGSGSYFLYHMYPDYKVYIDGARLDEVYGEAGFFHYMKIGNDLNTLLADIERYDLRSFILPVPPSEDEIVVPYRFLSSDPRWKLAYFDDAYLLFVREDEARARGIPTFTYLSIFSNIEEILKTKPEGDATLSDDFALAQGLAPDSLSIMVLKIIYQIKRGDQESARVNIDLLARYCAEHDPTTDCRKLAAHHLMRFRGGPGRSP